MPAAFAREFEELCDDVSVTSLAVAIDRCNVNNVIAANNSDSDMMASTFRRVCMYCRAAHQEHLPCSCFRCGYRHEGDCATVCGRCRRCHLPGEVRCHLRPVTYFSSVIRNRAIFSNDGDEGERQPALRHSLGDMNVVCIHCQSKSWQREKMNCCHGGDIVVEWDVVVPSELRDVILCSHVRQNIRPYNTVLAFASTGHANKSLIGGTFVLGGRTYHRIGSLLPGEA